MELAGMRQTVEQTVEQSKLIVIIRGVEREKLIPLVAALKEGGIRMVEITYSANGKISDEEIASRIEMLVKEFGEEMYIGAGTVLTEKQVELTKNAGGTFIISPDVYEPVIRKTKELGMISMPGALTPTEIRTAVRFGADFVKVFPASSMGASYIKAVAAPLSNVKMLAVGGVNLENMQEYYKAGALGFGLGSNIIDKKLIDAGDFAGVTKLAKAYVDKASQL
jgi:2-dehydro-3-deoxyphosphogluconate aldolase/(4S)-4-hydroxy-2-oxoglutarate aldolase